MTTATSSSLNNLFNADFYRANNIDLAGFNNQQALDHWLNFGINEGRVFSPLIDLNLYRARNADLAGFNNRQLLDHLVNFGVNENRIFSPFVDLQFYQDSNPDLQGKSRLQLLEHLSTNGINEYRAFSKFIDLNFYQASNSDLASFNNRQLFDHLFQHGLNEGRTFSPYFDFNFYRASNSDLASLSNRQLFDHFHIHGLNEGRRFSPLPFSNVFGYGLVDASAAVALASGQSPFAEVPDTSSWNLDRIKAPEVWNRGYTGQGVVVAVIDSGVDYFHPDLDNNIWSNSDEIDGNGVDDDGNGYIDDVQGWDFLNGDNTPLDIDGHGTHVAGIIAAENNGIGVTGVAYNAKIMPVKVLDLFGTAADNDVAAGIRYAVNNGADVINLSLGGSSPYPQTTLAIKEAIQKGVVVVSSAGNSGGLAPEYPARYSTHFGIAVGAVDSSNNIASYWDWASNRAGTTPLDYVVAPGVSIYSTSVDSTSLSSTYEFMDGTSFAAPHIAGVAALMLSANPNVTPVVVESILTGTANSGNVRLFSASSVNSVSRNSLASAKDDLNFQAQGIGNGDTSSSQMQTARLQAMSGATPSGFYDLTFGDDYFELTPGLLAGSPLGLRALDGNDFILGSSDSEMISGNQGSDFLFGGGGNDFVWGGKDDDFMYGEDGDDNLNGNIGNDFVFGGAGNDLIRGGKDLDVLNGEAGNDTLIGDLGTDALTGDAGSDLFVLRTDTIFSDPNSVDFILDFNPFSDRIGLTGGFTQANLVLTQQNLSLSSAGLDPISFRQSILSLTGVDIDPNGDGILSGTSISLNSGSLLGFAVNVTPTNLSGNFVSVSV